MRCEASVLGAIQITIINYINDNIKGTPRWVTNTGWHASTYLFWAPHKYLFWVNEGKDHGCLRGFWDTKGKLIFLRLAVSRWRHFSPKEERGRRAMFPLSLSLARDFGRQNPTVSSGQDDPFLLRCNNTLDMFYTQGEDASHLSLKIPPLEAGIWCKYWILPLHLHGDLRSGLLGVRENL